MLKNRDEHTPPPLFMFFTGRNCLEQCCARLQNTQEYYVSRHSSACVRHKRTRENVITRLLRAREDNLFACDRASYPERNFGWNQLLDSSIGLSPLCQTEAMDLHVTTATDLHHSFLGLRPRQA